ncbi:MAG: hypothetical protein R2694_05660 [Ilumatobacteraceae bacterium]|nr:hypothetical protein [Acidimicrobiaceae bacterium]
MGFMDRQREIYQQKMAEMHRLLVPGEVLYGVIMANHQKMMSAKFFLVATTDRRIILQPVNRKVDFDGPAISYGPQDITNASVWGWAHDAASRAEKVKTFLTTSGDRIRFDAGGQTWKLMTLGGNMFENMLATDEQLAGLEALIGFLAAAQPR